MAIDDETGNMLVLTEEQLDKVITFASTATREGDEPLTSTSEATNVVAAVDDGDGDGNGDGGGDGDGDGDGNGDGETLTVEIGDDYAGQDVTAWLFSNPRDLGTSTVASNGQIRVALPRDVAPGEHMFAVYDSDGQLIGFDTIVVAGAGADGGSGGFGGAVGGVLPDTGSPASMSLWMLGVVMILAGGALLAPAAIPRLVSRIRRTSMRLKGVPRHLMP